MTREEITEGLRLLEDNMVYFDELLNDKGKWIDVHELLFEAIEVLEQEPCEDCISREYILSKAHCCRDDFADDEPCCVDADDIKGAPSVQPKPKMGHWKKLNVGYGCSECSLATNKSGVDFYRFCPNCGAKMESEDKE